MSGIMSRPAMVTVSMFLNQTSFTKTDPTVINYVRPRTNMILLLFQYALAALKVVQVAIPLYLLVLLAMTHPTIQRRVLYGHRGVNLVSTSLSSRAALERPESQGFLRNQVTQHFVLTSDKETLHSWLLMPVGTYIRHEDVLTRSWSVEEAREIALQYLRDDPKAILAIFLHDNGEHLATPRRCEAYRNISAGSPDHLYVLAFDYRGFGKSSGRPTEQGLVLDAMSILSWVEKKLNIPRKKVLLVGHGLGASVAVAAVHKVMEMHRYAEFAGLVLCSAFTDMSQLATNFKLAGIVPILKPLTWSKRGRQWIRGGLLADSWKIEQRLKEVVMMSEVIRLSIIHTVDDDCIPQATSDVLYSSCIDGLVKMEEGIDTIFDLGHSGCLREVRSGGKLVRKVTLSSGGHTMYLKWQTMRYEAARILTMTGAIE